MTHYLRKAPPDRRKSWRYDELDIKQGGPPGHAGHAVTIVVAGNSGHFFAGLRLSNSLASRNHNCIAMTRQDQKVLQWTAAEYMDKSMAALMTYNRFFKANTPRTDEPQRGRHPP